MCIDGGIRKRVSFDANPGMLFLNTAVVPRVHEHENWSLHHFCLVETSSRMVIEAKDIWVRVAPNPCTIEHEVTLFKRDISENHSAWLLNTHTNEKETVQLVPPSDCILLDSDSSVG